MFDIKNLQFNISCVYKITNKRDGKIYIGSAKCFKKRTQDHFNKLKRKVHPNAYLQNVYNKWGKDIFKIEIIEEVKNLNNLITIEQKWIDEYWDNQTDCYNMCPTAGSALGRKHKKETKTKISNSHKGKKVSEETRKKFSINSKKNIENHFKCGKENPMWGKNGKKHHNWGMKHENKVKEKISKIHQGNNYNGKKVYQYNFDGKYIRNFRSCAEAVRIIGVTGISSCCNGNKKSAGGFIWSYIKKENMMPYEKKNRKGIKHNCKTIIKIKNKIKTRKGVFQINKENDKIINSFDSMLEAERKTGISNTHISSCCRGYRKSAGGFKWIYRKKYDIIDTK